MKEVLLPKENGKNSISTYAKTGLLVKPNYAFLLMKQEETHGKEGICVCLCRCLLVLAMRRDRGGLEEEDPVLTGPRAGGTASHSRSHRRMTRWAGDVRQK